MDWDKLRVFHAVAEAGSFTHAGETLNLSQSSVSRQIGALEKTLNAPLFHRHARGLKLTETGRDAVPHRQGSLGQARHGRGLGLRELETGRRDR